MTGPWNILRHVNVWSAVMWKDGDGGDGGSKSSSTSKSSSAAKDKPGGVSKSSSKDKADGGGQFQGPMPDGTAGYSKDVSKIGVDPSTGFLTGDDDDDDDSVFQGPTLTGPGYTQDVSTIGVDPTTGFLTDDDDDVGMTPVTPLDTTGGIESLLAPPGTGATDVYDDDDFDFTPVDTSFVDSITDIEDVLAPPGTGATDVYDDDFTYQGPMLDGTPGYTQDISQMDVDEDTGFITADLGAVDYTPAPPPITPITPAAPVIMAPPTGILTAEQAAAQQAGILAQQQAYQDMLERARAAEVARIPTLPMTPTPVDFVPSQDLRDETGSLLAPARDRSGVTSIGYDIGQIDPGLARAAGIEAGQPAFGQTTGQTTLEQLYGADITPTLDNLGDLTLGTGMFDEARQLLETRPDLMLAPTPGQTVVATGQVPAGTPGAQAPQDIYMADEVQTLIEASPQARQVYDAMGLTPFSAGTYSIGLASGTQSAPTQIINYRDQQGNVYSQAEALDRLRAAGAQTTTLPGGYTAIAPLDVTTPTVPAIDLGLTSVDVATPITVVSGGGGGGGGGGTRGGGAGRGDPRDFGFVAEEAAASRGSPAGIEGLLERSPTLGQPASTTVPQASDIIMPGVETSPTVTREPPPPMAPPGGEEAPSVDVTIAPRDEVGGEPDAAEEVEVQVDTGDDQGMGAEEDTGTGREEPGAPGGAEGEEGAGEGVEVDIGGGEDEGAGTGGEGTGIGTGEGEGEGAGEGPGTGTGTGGGEGAGEGTGIGDGTGTGTGGEEVEVDVVDEEPPVEEEDEEPPVEEEEPAFECPPGFRRVQMANGGFTCVPTMVRPRVGPYTQTVDVSGLRGRTVFRPGTRRP